MKTKFYLENLKCADCAIKIENALAKSDGVISASVNPITCILQLETIDIPDIHIIEHIVHHCEPDVQIKREKTDQTSSPTVWLIISTIAFAVGMVLYYGFAIGGHITFALFAISYLLVGTKILIRMMRNIVKGQIFDENFLMGVATIGAIAIGEYSGAVAVMLFYRIGEFFQEKAVAKSKKNIAELMDIRPDYANLQKNNEIIKVAPQTVNIGDIIVVKPGEKIPLDGRIISGEANLDTSSLTGESVPRNVKTGDTVLSGCVNQNGVLTIEVTQNFGESTASKIIDLVENASSKKAHIETFITKFAGYYTPVVMLLALLIATVPPLFFEGMWADWIYRSLVLLIIACPCALVLSIPLGFFGGIGAASKKGILVKGGNYLEALANLETIVFDKTGTLTKGVFKVTKIVPTNNFTKDELLKAAAYAEVYSNHPIAQSIIKEYDKIPNKESITQYEEIAGYGVRTCIAIDFLSSKEEADAASGQKSLQVEILAGNEKLMHKNSIPILLDETFGTKVYIAINDIYAGCIIISDEVKPDSAKAIQGLRVLGVKRAVMLTGDTQEAAQAVAQDVKLDQVYASLLPHQKVEHVELLKKHTKKTLAFVGDGINDAPVLALSDVGVAMGGLGSDAAIEAADVVLMTDEPSKLIEAVKVARFTKKIIWQNIIFALVIQVLFLVLGTMGIASIWEAIFADVGVSLLAVLNTWRILKLP